MSFTRTTVLTALFAFSAVASSCETANASCGGRRSGGVSRSYSSFHRPTHYNSYTPARQYVQPGYHVQPAYQHSQPINVVSQPVAPVTPRQVAPAPIAQQTPFQQISQPQQPAVQQPTFQQPVQPAERSASPAAQPTPAAPNAAQSALQALGGYAPPATSPVAPAVQPASQPLVGSWTAAVGNGSTVTLTLEEDGHFRWVATNSSGQSSRFEGTYNAGNGSLSLQRANDSQQLAGSLTITGTSTFSFKVAGNNAAALNFQRSN